MDPFISQYENWPGELKWGRMKVSGNEDLVPFEPHRSFFDQIQIDGLLGDENQTVLLDFLGEEVFTIKVLYGLNGAGKTTVLRLIESVIDKNISRLLCIPFKKIIFNRTERLSERWDHHEVMRPGISLWTYSPEEATNFLRIHPWQNNPDKAGHWREVGGKRTEHLFDHPSLSQEETLNVKKWAQKNPSIVTYEDWTNVTDDELFNGTGEPLEIEMPDIIHSLEITKDHNGYVHFLYSRKPDLYTPEFEKEYRELFQILNIEESVVNIFFGGQVESASASWTSKEERYNALCYELGREKASKIQKDIVTGDSNLDDGNPLFKHVKTDVLSVFNEQSLNDLISQGFYDIDNVENVLNYYSGYVNSWPIPNNSIINRPVNHSSSNDINGWAWREMEEKIKTFKLVINTDLENNRDYLLSSVKKLLKGYANTLQIRNYNFFHYDSEIFKHQFFKERYPPHVLKLIEKEILVDTDISLNMQKSIWSSIGKSIQFYFENPKIQNKELDAFFLSLRAEIAPLLYPKELERIVYSSNEKMYVKVKPQDRTTWSKKWKHPSVAISQKALSYLPHSKALNIDKNIKFLQSSKPEFEEYSREVFESNESYQIQLEAYNSVFCGVEIINDLLEDKYLFLDNQMNLCVSNGLEIEDLSHGELRLINIIVSIHMSLLRSKRESVIILIDEPEVGLHLKWQSKLMDALGNLLRVHQSDLLNFRILLASHSPEIVGSYPHLSTSLRIDGFD